MRDLVAGVIAVVLLLVAASLATTLHILRRRRQRARAAERGARTQRHRRDPRRRRSGAVLRRRGRIPLRRARDRQGSIAAARVLINGSPIAAVVSTGTRELRALPPHQLRRSPGRHRPRSVGRRRRNHARHRAGRVRRDSRTRVAGAGARGFRAIKARRSRSETHGPAAEVSPSHLSGRLRDD